MEFKEINNINNLITLEQLWAVFTKIKLIPYGSTIGIRTSFKADTEMIYNCLQKELNAQAQLGMN